MKKNSVIITISLLHFIIWTALCQAQTLEENIWQHIIEKHGYNTTTVTDMSGEQKIKLAEPYCAYVNITGIDEMPTGKTQNMHAWLECYDGNGNYFKKRIILNAQGNSSMRWIKKNLSVDFCEDEWIGEKETDITIGQWVKQSSFHLKANYSTYFRGEGQIGYMIYEDIIRDRKQPYPWQRAQIVDANERALCHPQAFPCYVFLNDDFYGLYAWSLKKHRKNMNLAKDVAEHIHLDGTLKDLSLWNGTVNYTAFEIRNPKTLYCVNLCEKQGTTTYAEYDGDAPCELIDESMPYYDATNEGHVLTNRVKTYIQQLSRYKANLKALEAAKADSATIRAKFEEYFDIEGLIDYVIFSYVTSNADGFEKNWQWFTYGGGKWYVQPYDLDCTFGNHYQGHTLFPPEMFWFYRKYNDIQKTGPINFLLKYYATDISCRYRDLRRSGQISCDSFMNHFHIWYERISQDGYDLEYSRWPNSPCNGESIISANWTTSDQEWLNYTPEEFQKVQAYDNTHTYQAGDKCTMPDHRVWTAENTTIGDIPYTKLAHTDSFERVENYIRRKIMLLDKYFGYSNDEDNIPSLQSDKQTISTHKIIRDKHLYIIRDGEVYSPDGKRVR